MATGSPSAKPKPKVSGSATNPKPANQGLQKPRQNSGSGLKSDPAEPTSLSDGSDGSSPSTTSVSEPTHRIHAQIHINMPPKEPPAPRPGAMATPPPLPGPGMQNMGTNGMPLSGANDMNAAMGSPNGPGTGANLGLGGNPMTPGQTSNAGEPGGSGGGMQGSMGQSSPGAMNPATGQPQGVAKPLPKKPPKEPKPTAATAQSRKRQTGVLKQRQAREVQGKMRSGMRDSDAGSGFYPPISPLL